MHFNDLRSTIDLLLSRRSAKAREMVAPGPDQAALRMILQAAMRVPDHGKLAPWRFIVVEKDQQEALGAAMADAYLAEKPDAGRLEVEAIRGFPTQAPVMVAVLSAIKHESHIPAWEQQLSAGAACQNLLVAAHALGFAGCWLTGWPAYAAAVRALLGAAPGDRVAGFIFLGTPGKPLSERPRPDYDDIVRIWTPAERQS